MKLRADPAEPPPRRRVRVPTVLQIEAVECGAAALGMVLGYFGRDVPLEELRIACGVSRDGSRAGNLLKAAASYGLVARAFKYEPASLPGLTLPMIAFWNFNHFVVVEGFGKNTVYLNDPAFGPREVTTEEFDASFTGLVMLFEAAPEFRKEKHRSTFVHALRERLGGSGAALAYVVLAGLGLVVPGLAAPVFIQVFVDDILVKDRHEWVAPLLIGMALTAVVRGCLTFLQRHTLLCLEMRLAIATSSKFMWHLMRLPMAFYGQRLGGDLATRVARNDSVAQFLAGQLANTVLSAATAIFYLILMLVYDVDLTFVGVCLAALNLVFLRFIAERRRFESHRVLMERGNLAGTSMNGLRIIETLKSMGSEDDFFARWSGHHAQLLNAETRLALSTLLLDALPPLLSGLNAALILGLGGLRVMSGDMTVGMLVAFQSLMAGFMEPIARFVGLGRILQEVDGDMRRLDDVMRYPLDRSFDVPSTIAPVTDAKLHGHVELKGITFGHSRLDPPLIQNLDLVLRPGSRIALVGGSGSGKSTVARLVAGLYEPWSGQILFDGAPREQFPRSVVSQSVSMVDQEIFLFEGTIADNLSLWNRTVPEARMIQASRDADLHDLVATRRRGYDSRVDEGGTNFSGGQRQRMEIARALVDDPTVLILDEATSALDPSTEKRIDDNLRRRGCTCLIVAHRLSTIRDCDEIIVLDRGKVVQRGTHDALCRQEGPYSALIDNE